MSVSANGGNPPKYATAPRPYPPPPPPPQPRPYPPPPRPPQQYPPQPPPKRSPIGWIIAIIIVVVALIVAAVFFLFRGAPNPAPTQSTTPTQTTEPPATHAPGTWSAMTIPGLDNIDDVIDSGVDGIALIRTNSSGGTCDITAIDLVKLSSIWSISSFCELIPSPEGLVAVQVSDASTGQMQTIDVNTGAIIGSTKLSANEDVFSVGGGIVYTQITPADGISVTGCARDMTLGPCLWKAPGNPTIGTDNSIGVFGGNSWVNTTKGVLDLRTGAKAKFGSGFDQCDGPTQNHVLCEGSNDTANVFQQVDTTTGQPIGPKIEAMYLVSFSADTSTYVFLQDETDSKTHMTGYSWDTGQKVFDNNIDGQLDYPDWSVPMLAWWQTGNSFWADYTDTSGADSFAAFSLTSGDLLWHDPDATPLGFTSVDGHSTVYVTIDNQLTGLDAATGQPILAATVADAQAVTIAGNRVVTLDAGTGTLQVLNP